MTFHTKIIADRTAQRAAQPAKTWAEYQADAREAAAVGGYRSAAADVIAKAWLANEVAANPAAKLAQKDAFFARFGVRRGDDARVAS